MRYSVIGTKENSVVLEFGSSMLYVGFECIKGDVKENDILIFENGYFVCDKELTENTKKELFERAQKLKNKKQEV